MVNGPGDFEGFFVLCLGLGWKSWGNLGISHSLCGLGVCMVFPHNNFKISGLSERESHQELAEAADFV